MSFSMMYNMLGIEYEKVEYMYRELKIGGFEIQLYNLRL